jgi:hypothetical protein
MQLGGCGRRCEITQKEIEAITPRERLPKRRMKATYDDGGGDSKARAAEAQRGDAFD